MILAAINGYEVVVAAGAIVVILTFTLTLLDRRSKRVRIERDEAERETVQLRARVTELEARPDMTRLAHALDAHETRAAERHERTIGVLEKIADAWDIRLRNGRT